MPLMELDPPSTRPRTHTSSNDVPSGSRRSKGNFHVRFGPDINRAIPLGMLISGLPSPIPASRSNTRVRGSADSRLAKTQPADPAPTTT